MRAMVAVAFIVCALFPPLGWDYWARRLECRIHRSLPRCDADREHDQVTKHDGSSPEAFIVDIINLLLSMSKRGSVVLARFRRAGVRLVVV